MNLRPAHAVGLDAFEPPFAVGVVGDAEDVESPAVVFLVKRSEVRELRPARPAPEGAEVEQHVAVARFTDCRGE